MFGFGTYWYLGQACAESHSNIVFHSCTENCSRIQRALHYCEALGSSLSKFLMWSTAFLQRPCLPPFDFACFSSQPFSGLGHNFFTARVFLVGIDNIQYMHYLCSNKCSGIPRCLSTYLVICGLDNIENNLMMLFQYRRSF